MHLLSTPTRALSFLRNLPLSLGFAAIIAASSAPATAQSEKIAVAIPSATALPYHGFIFLGIPAGFYKKLGVNVEFLTINGSSAALQLVASGDAKFAHIGLSALVAAKKTVPSLPVHAVFLQDRTPIYSVGIIKKTGIAGLSGLKGKRIGVLNLASGAVPWMKAYLAEEGLKESDYEIVSIGSGAQAYAVMQSGQVDAICFSTGLTAALEILGADMTYFTRQEASGVIVANDAFVKEHPDLATKVLQGIILNQTFMEANPEASVRYHWQVAGKPTGISEQEAIRQGVIYIKTTAEMWKDYKDTAQKWGLMTDENWTNLLEFKPIAATFASAADQAKFVSSLYTNALIEGANKVDLSIALDAAAAQQSPQKK